MSAPPTTVFLLHGLWMHAPTWGWFAAGLRRAGFKPQPLGFTCLVGNAERVQSQLTAALAAHPGAHVVGHSLGGLLGLQAARSVPLGRVVCLGSPVQGSAAAQVICTKLPRASRLLGHQRDLLRQGVAAAWPQGVEVGMVAGSGARGLGRYFTHFDGVHDGTVALHETQAPGLRDHIVVPASHSGLVVSPAALAQTVAFLRAGGFNHSLHTVQAA